MKAAINIDHGISPEATEKLGDIVTNIFYAGFETRMDQETIRAGLDLVANNLRQPPSNYSINNCSFVMRPAKSDETDLDSENNILEVDAASRC